MAYYFVKRDLFGIKAGHVERFAPNKAAGFMADGSIEPYDPKQPRHAKAPGSADAEAFLRARQSAVIVK